MVVRKKTENKWCLENIVQMSANIATITIAKTNDQAVEFYTTKDIVSKFIGYELYNSEYNYTFSDFVKLFGPQIILPNGIPAWFFCIKHKEKIVYVHICKEGDRYQYYRNEDDKNNLRLDITDSDYLIMFCNYIDSKLGRSVKLYDEDDIVNITKIQRGCENWLDKPICKDNTVGINPRLAFKKIEKLV